jgi:hypothetical protein
MQRTVVRTDVLVIGRIRDHVLRPNVMSHGSGDVSDLIERCGKVSYAACACREALQCDATLPFPPRPVRPMA